MFNKIINNILSFFMTTAIGIMIMSYPLHMLHKYFTCTEITDNFEFKVTVIFVMSIILMADLIKRFLKILK